MWSIRFLSGKMAGQVLQLQQGSIVIGRAPNCDIVIAAQGISKNHMKLDITSDKVIVTDMGSSNGTFVNGIQVRSQRVQSGDKIGAHDVMFELSDRVHKMPTKRSSHPRPSSRDQQMPSMNGNLAQQMNPTPMDVMPGAQMSGAPQQAPGIAAPGIVVFAQQYFENVVMPGVYKLAEWLEFRWVIGLFVAAFIVSVTTLSSFPLMRILKDSVESESRDNAQNLARFLADKNTSAFKAGIASAYNVNYARSRGVEKAYLLNAAGTIVAPPEMAGKWPEETFVNAARTRGKPAVEVIDGSTVGALEPIRDYNPNVNATTALGYAVVIYNMATLEVSEGKTFSLLIQVFCVALILGFVLYGFFVKLIEHPIEVMNQQVKDALSDGRTQVVVAYQFPQLQELATNINSAVQRALSGDIGAVAGSGYEADRTAEMQGILNAVGFAAAAINVREKSFAATNSHFQEQVTRNQDWVHTKLESILEQSLRLNMINLVDLVAQSPTHSGADELEINNTIYSISAQGVLGSKELNYIIFVFTPKAVG